MPIIYCRSALVHTIHVYLRSGFCSHWLQIFLPKIYRCYAKDRVVLFGKHRCHLFYSTLLAISINYGNYSCSNIQQNYVIVSSDFFGRTKMFIFLAWWFDSSSAQCLPKNHEFVSKKLTRNKPKRLILVFFSATFSPMFCHTFRSARNLLKSDRSAAVMNRSSSFSFEFAIFTRSNWNFRFLFIQKRLPVHTRKHSNSNSKSWWRWENSRVFETK